MLENLILEHNEGIATVEKDIAALRYKLNSDLKRGDTLKFDEISGFIQENALDRVWFFSEQFDTVYGGELFDLKGIQKRLVARGTLCGEYLLQLMKSAFDFKEETVTVPYDCDAKVISIFVFTLKK